MTAPRLKHNPSHMSDAELIRNFVVRQHDLELVLERLRDNRGASNQHVLVLGPRGMGKTTLINRVIAEIRRDEALGAAWYPIAFNEESYTVTSAAELWLQALVHLADQTRDRTLAATVEQLRQERDDTRLRDRALARLMDFADAEEKRLLVVLENIDMLFEQQMSDSDAWDIRHTLQNEPRLMILATSTTRLDAFHDSDKALYELFWEHALERLDLPEIQAVWRIVTGDELPLHRARPIQILTGGNTRLLVILASFARGRSFRELLTDLVALIDENTPYFKHNVESLPPEERKIFVTLADLWRPSGSRQVAEVARTEARKTSSLLGRLEKRGAVEEVRRIDHAKLYQVSERMYNLYHLLRSRNNERVRALVEFIVQFYDREQLFDLIPSIAGEACASENDSRADIVHAVLQLVQQLPSAGERRSILDKTPAEFRALPEAAAMVEELLHSSESAPTTHDEQSLRDRLKSSPDDIAAWGELGDLMREGGDIREAERCYLEGWKRDRGQSDWLIRLWATDSLRGKPTARAQKWRALMAEAEAPAMGRARTFLAVALAEALQAEPARQEAGRAIEEAAHDPWIASFCGLAYFRLGDLASASEALRHAHELSPFSLGPSRQLARVLIMEGRYGEAMDVLREAIGRHPRDEKLRLMLFDLLLHRMHDTDAARAAIEDAHALMPENSEISRRLADLLLDQGECRRATSLCERLLAAAPSAHARLRLIHCYLLEGEVERAEQALAKWEEAEVEDTAIRLSAGAAIRSVRGDHVEAALLMQKAWSLEPEHQRIFSSLFRCLIRIGEFGTARTTAEVWIARHPGGAGQAHCARLVADEKRALPLLDDALQWARGAVLALPTTAVRLTLARLLTRKGSYAEAMSSLAVILDGPALQEHLSEVTGVLIALAAAGEAPGVLRGVESSRGAPLLEALIVALRRIEGLEANPPKEVSEVADDIVREIEEIKARAGRVTVAAERRREAPEPARGGAPGDRRSRPG